MQKISFLIRFLLFIFILAGVLSPMSCNKDPNNGYYEIPYVYVYYTINLTLPKYSELNLPGGHFYLNEEGYKGIIVYHAIDDTYKAFERACTYRPQDDCSKITMDESGIYMRCGEYDNSDFVECCGSDFDMSGFVMNPPALYPLKQYQVSVQGDALTITN
ncbi:Rieske (2Fe-2S) protein [Bacteroidota bacterium]